jgi:hypothetical protein
MTILDDLNSLALGTTLATVSVCSLFAAVAIIDRRKHRSARGIGLYLILLAGLYWCGFLGLNTLDNVSDAKHSSITGQVKVTGYLHGPRGTHINLYQACLTNCDSLGVLLVMEPKAQSILRDHPDLPAFKIGYLSEGVKAGSDRSAFKVVDISDPTTGTSFYHLDTSLHPWRAWTFFADAVLFLLTALLGIYLAIFKSNSSTLSYG